MTQVINKKLMKCCDCCKSHFDKPCAWLSLGNEYCTEIMETQKVIEQLTNNWNQLEEYMKTEWNNKNYGAEYKIALSKVYNKLQELEEKQMIEDLDIYEDVEDDEDNLE